MARGKHTSTLKCQRFSSQATRSTATGSRSYKRAGPARRQAAAQERRQERQPLLASRPQFQGERLQASSVVMAVKVDDEVDPFEPIPPAAEPSLESSIDSNYQPPGTLRALAPSAGAIAPRFGRGGVRVVGRVGAGAAAPRLRGVLVALELAALRVAQGLGPLARPRARPHRGGPQGRDRGRLQPDGARPLLGADGARPGDRGLGGRAQRPEPHRRLPPQGPPQPHRAPPRRPDEPGM